jgi:hypothetical protein
MAPLADGAAERSAESLSKKFASLQADSPPSTQKGSDDITAWSSSRKEVVFDWQSTREFPEISEQPSTPTPTQNMVPDDSATQARSARSTHTSYTTDLDTTVSELKTVVTESIAAQSQMLQQFIQTSQQQQQQLLAATQSQQATTNQLLHHMSSLMATLVSGQPPSPSLPPPPSTIPTLLSTDQSPSISSQAPSTTPDSTVSPSTTVFTLQTSSPIKTSSHTSHTSPNKRPAPPDDSSDRRRGPLPQDTDTCMQITDYDPEDPANPTEASPMLDPDPGSQ